MFDCDCCEREVVPQKMPGIGYYCGPCLAEQTLREYPWTMSDEKYADYLRIHEQHADVCASARLGGPMRQ